MKNIITIQHAQSIHHTNGMIGSWTDWDLSGLGVRQAENIGRNLAAELAGTRFRVISSDLLRARHTAEIVAGCLGAAVELDGALRERNLGEAVGKSREWARAHSPGFEKTVDDRAFSGSESRRDVWNRLLPFLGGVMSCGDENILIVSHGDALSLFHAMWLGLEIEMLNRCNLSGLPGGVSFLSQSEDGKRVISRLSDMSYARMDGQAPPLTASFSAPAGV